jgi:hypothetical protein
MLSCLLNLPSTRSHALEVTLIIPVAGTSSRPEASERAVAVRMLLDDASGVCRAASRLIGEWKSLRDENFDRDGASAIYTRWG